MAPPNAEPSASALARSRTYGVRASSRHAEELTVGLELRRRALVADVERGEPVDLVAEEVEADRFLGRRAEDVDDPAAHRELAAVLDGGSRR